MNNIEKKTTCFASLSIWVPYFQFFISNKTIIFFAKPSTNPIMWTVYLYHGNLWKAKHSELLIPTLGQHNVE
jgi:hypothetical protein